MKAQATLKYARTSARKARLVADLIRGMHVRDAEVELKYLSKKAASFFSDVLKSAVANAENNNSMDKSKLYVSEVLVNEGTYFKRFQPRAFGKAFPILKKTSHITISVSEKESDVKERVEKVKAVKAKNVSKASSKKEVKKEKAPAAKSAQASKDNK